MEEYLTPGCLFYVYGEPCIVVERDGPLLYWRTMELLPEGFVTKSNKILHRPLAHIARFCTIPKWFLEQHMQTLQERWKLHRQIVKLKSRLQDMGDEKKIQDPDASDKLFQESKTSTRDLVYTLAVWEQEMLKPPRRQVHHKLPSTQIESWNKQIARQKEQLLQQLSTRLQALQECQETCRSQMQYELHSRKFNVIQMKECQTFLQSEIRQVVAHIYNLSPRASTRLTWKEEAKLLEQPYPKPPNKKLQDTLLKQHILPCPRTDECEWYQCLLCKWCLCKCQLRPHCDFCIYDDPSTMGEQRKTLADEDIARMCSPVDIRQIVSTFSF